LEKYLIALGAKASRKAAINGQAKEYILSNEVLFKTIKKAADRYIGGETLEETIIKVQDKIKKDLNVVSNSWVKTR